MNISEPFLRRPIGTVLLTVAATLAGAVAFATLPVAPMPQVDFPTISVNASLPGASPEIMASSVAAPLERTFGRIAAVTEMTSDSSLGSSRVTLQFDLDRNIDAAARDVMAAINAARAQLPANLPNNPGYRKVNPADAPIMVLALTSDAYTKGRLYDLASTILAQKISQLEGVGQVTVGGSSLPAIRIELNPAALYKYGIGLDQVRSTLASANANIPKGAFENGSLNLAIEANDQLFQAQDYAKLILAYNNGAPVRVEDVAEVIDSVENVRNAGFANGRPSVLLIVSREPNANIIDTVDRIRAVMPQLKASVPQGVRLDVLMDQTTTIRASVHDVEMTLILSILLVILVVFAFLRDWRSTLIPGVAVPVSLIATFGVMKILGFSLNNISLMALTISTGFVVDDAIVVLENVTRHMEEGLSPLEAARQGAREIGFTVLSMSLSLVAVFIPLLLMGGLVGRMFREFAVTLSVAVLISLLVSLTTTPMMCSRLLRRPEEEKRGRLYHASERAFNRVADAYRRSLAAVLRHPGLTLLSLVATIALNFYLFGHLPKGFFPEQDIGRLSGSVVADQGTSFRVMQQYLRRLIEIVSADPAVASVAGFTGGGAGNSANIFIMLKPRSERPSAEEVIDRLRPKLQAISGAALYLQPQQDIRVGGRGGNSLYQYTLVSDEVGEVTTWAPKLLAELKQSPVLTDPNSDQQLGGRQTYLTFDRDTAARLGITAKQIDNTLYGAYGQALVSTMYADNNQYHVVMEVAPQYADSPETLRDLYVRAPTGQMVPLSSFARYETSVAPLAIRHQGPFPSITLSFGVARGKSLGDAVEVLDKAKAKIGFPPTIRAGFAGTAQAFQSSLKNEPILILASLGVIYIVLGMLYENTFHPLTILSTLPSAGVGACLALWATHTELSLIAIIGIILLIGIVKKNAILMIDFAITAERDHGRPPREAIEEACHLRFRPILMTTMAAMLGAVPLACAAGIGSELRRPLGIAIIGGLALSQLLTLYTTPVVYLALDRLRLSWRRRLGLSLRPAEAAA